MSQKSSVLQVMHSVQLVLNPDNPAAFESDLAYIEQLITDLKAESVLAEGNRPSMKPKKD